MNTRKVIGIVMIIIGVTMMIYSAVLGCIAYYSAVMNHLADELGQMVPPYFRKGEDD